MIFGQLQEEPLTPSKDSTLLNSNYSTLIDITPKIEDIRRLTLIPRLSKLKVSNSFKNYKIFLE